MIYERAHLLRLYLTDVLLYMVSGCVGGWGAECAAVALLHMVGVFSKGIVQQYELISTRHVTFFKLLHPSI